jgi:hypothetical protein
MIGLPTRFISSAELFFLLAHYVATFVSPLGSLLTGFTRSVLYIFAAFFGTRPQLFSGLIPRTRCVQNSRRRSQT